MCVDGSVVAKEIVAPDVGKQLVSGQSDIPVFNQVKKQIVFFRSKLHFVTVHSNGSGRNIDFQAVEFKRLLRHS